jgi:hypothetical protein
MPSVQVFLTYRRADASAWAGRLAEDIAMRFGRDAVFQDVVAIEPGERFPARIQSALTQANVVLALIGPRWLDGQPPDSTRLADPADYVRRELLLALEQDKRIIPVLVGDAAMPSAAQLPPELESIAERQAVALRDDRWRADVDGLLRTLGGEPYSAPRHHRRTRRLVSLAAVAVFSAAAVGWLVLGGGRDGSGSKDAAADFCPAPEGADWTTLTTTKPYGDGIEGRWTFLVEGGGYRRAAGDTWEVVLRPRLVNRADFAQRHRDVYRLVVNDAAHEPTCFQIESGPEEIGTDQNSYALVGFEIDQEPLDTVTLHADDDSGHMHVDVSAR